MDERKSKRKKRKLHLGSLKAGGKIIIKKIVYTSVSKIFYICVSLYLT